MKDSNFLEERDKRWKSHNWSGWPGAFCLHCFIDDPLEQAVAYNIEDTDKWDCPSCTFDKNKTRICYIGELSSVINSLRSLGSEISFYPDDYCKGFIITDPIPMAGISKLRECFYGPVIIKGNQIYDYTGVNVLVLDETERDLFYKRYDIQTLQECKDTLQTLKIHYLVVALTKEEIKQQVQHNLPKSGEVELNITDEQVAEARDNLTALVGYIYIKEGTLSAEAIKRANTGAALSVLGFTGEDLKDFYIDINFKEMK